VAYAIMRAKKLATMGAAAASMKHNFRERETPNADRSRTHENEHLVAGSTNEAMGRLRELLPEKRRKDAVLAVEYVMTASPEWWARADQAHQRAFFERSLNWLQEKYGARNVLVATIQRDEKTPHLSAFVVPKTRDGRLSAKEFIGNRQKMRADQTSFAERVRELGLERGIEGSKVTHQRVKQFYGEVDRDEPAHARLLPAALTPRVLEKRFLTRTVEDPQQVAARLTEAMQKHYAPAMEQARQGRLQARRAREVAQTAQTKAKELKAAQEKLQELRNRSRELLELLARGGPTLEQLQKHIRENLERERLTKQRKAEEQEQERSRGWSL
jgi:predicted CopG family antitoxin